MVHLQLRTSVLYVQFETSKAPQRNNVWINAQISILKINELESMFSLDHGPYVFYALMTQAWSDQISLITMKIRSALSNESLLWLSRRDLFMFMSSLSI